MRVKLIMRLIAVIILLFMLPAQADGLREGVDYTLVNPPQPVRVDVGEIEVVEFFNFACPHCFRVYRYFEKWQSENAEKDVKIIHQPVVFPKFKGHYARVYYTLDALGIAEEYAIKVYKAIHVDRRLINSKGRFLDWLEESGIDTDQAEQIYDSFTVNSRAARAETVADDYGISSTPQFSVAGKYVVNAQLSGSYENLMETLTALVERERQEQAQ